MTMATPDAHTPNVKGLGALLSPRSVALMGASESGVGRRLLEVLMQHGYTGPVYPINPNRTEVLGRPCFPGIRALPEVPDLAVIAVAAARVEGSLREAGEAGVPAALVLSSGFGETGPEGKEREARLAEVARETGIRVLGPNSIGLINPRAGLAATFSSAAQIPAMPTGHAAFVSQSGSMAGSFLNRAYDYNLGVSAIISTGNEADVQLTDVVMHLLDDPETRVIGLFLEGLRNGPAFKIIAQMAAERGKPLVVLKGARSELGQKAAISHTGAVAGEDRVYSGLFRHLAVVQVDELDELLPTMAALSAYADRLPAGRGVGLISASGGAAVLATDAAAAVGLEVPAFGPAVHAALRPVLPDFTSVVNPLDVTAQLTTNNPGALEACVLAVGGDPAVDYVAIMLSMRSGAGDGTVTGTVKALDRVAAPVLVTSVAGSLGASGMQLLRSHGVPTFSDPARAMRCIGRLVTYKEDRDRLLGRTALVTLSSTAPAIPPGSGVLDEVQSKALLRSAGIPVVPERTAGSAAAVVEQAEALGFPVVMKVLEPKLAHKTESGAVLLDLKSPDDLRAGWERLTAQMAKLGHTLTRVVLQPMIQPVAEGLIGVTHDDQFGPMVTFGAGGIFVELLDDVALRPAPLSLADAQSMIGQTRFSKLLAGARGRPPGDRKALAETLVRIGALAAQAGPRIREIDLNPVAVLPDGEGVVVLDALIVTDGVSGRVPDGTAEGGGA